MADDMDDLAKGIEVEPENDFDFTTPDHKASKETVTDKWKTWRSNGDSGNKSNPYPPMPRKGIIAKGAADFYTMIGMGWSIVDKRCGMALVETSADIGEAWEDVCRSSPKTRKAILSVIETGAWGKLIAAHATIGMAVFMHHTPMGRNIEDHAAKQFADEMEDSLKNPPEAA